MGVIIYSFDLSISCKMAYGVLECDHCCVIELHVYNFVMKRGCYLCWTCVCVCIYFGERKLGGRKIEEHRCEKY